MGVSLVFRGFCAGTGRRARRFQTPHLIGPGSATGIAAQGAKMRAPPLDFPTLTALGFLLCIAGAIWPETRYCATSLH